MAAAAWPGDEASPKISLQDVDALLRLGQRLERLSSPFAPDAGAGCFPVYADEVIEFFRLAGQPCWSDLRYANKPAQAMMADDARIAAASLGEIRTLLTYCVRGERFGDGFWGELLRKGRIAAILQRLAELRAGCG